MRCAEYEDMISAFIDGALAEEDCELLMEHMAGCTACQNYFNDQIAIHNAISALRGEIQAPDGLAESVMTSVRRSAASPGSRGLRPLAGCRGRAPARWAVLAACCTLAALGMWAAIGRGGAGQMQMAVTNTAAGEGADAGIADAPEAEESYYFEDRSVDPAAASEYAMADSAAAPKFAETGSAASATLTTASPVAGAWVEDYLGTAWVAGSVYKLTAAEFDELKAILEEAGEVYTESGTMESESFLLIFG